jgi:hypothetical protein
MKNYFKWIMLFIYLVAIGAVVNYYTDKYEKEKTEDRMEKEIEADTLSVEPIVKDSLMQEESQQIRERY